MNIDTPAPGRQVRAAVAAVLGSAALLAYQPIAAAAEEAAELEEVQVTGSRIKQAADYVSPNPVTTFDAADLEKLGINNISDAIVQVPQNVSQFTPANTGGSAFYVGSTLANLRGLNPFFGTRTLTLVDSRRFIPTTQGDAVDLNFVPSNLVSRVETVTGGASAAYGSGAISGVVNVMLDKRLQGVKIDADYGLTGQKDGDNRRIGLAAGTAFGDGRGHIVAGGEFQKMDAIQSCSDARDWCARNVGLYNNSTSFFGGAGVPFTHNIVNQPQYIVTPNLRENQVSRSGVIFNGNSGATTTSQFNAGGTGIVPFAIGAQGWRAANIRVQGGDGPPAYENLTLQPNVKRMTAFSHGEFEFNDAVTGYAELSYGKVQGVNNQFAANQNTAANCIHPDNAYLGTLTAAARTAITNANNNQPFATFPNEICGNPFGFGAPGTVVMKNWQGQNDQVVSTDTKVLRGVLGATGTLPNDWTWDAYYQYGKTTRDQVGAGYRTNWRYTFAMDSVIDNRVGSATNGQAVCRVTRDGFNAAYPSLVGVVDPILAQGCQPLNPFGENTASAAGLGYAFSSLTEHNVIRQDVLAASISGRVFDGWAGPVSAAVGGEWRKDKLSNNAGDDPAAIRTDFGLQYGDSFAGSTKVTEGFAELEVPLARDMMLVKRASLNMAGRVAQYKTSGATGGAIGGSNTSSISTWKLAGVWDVLDALRFRGSYSRDIRAPNFRELFYSQTIPAGGLFGTVTNPWIKTNLDPFGQNSDPTVWKLTGNTNLDPEKSRTTTIGMVLQPGGKLDGIQFSVDWYKISLKGGLSLSLGGPSAVTGCFNGDAFLCSLLTFGAPRPGQESNPDAARTNITSMQTVYQNANPYIAKGVDLSFDYRLPARALGIPGTFSVAAATTHIYKQIAPVLGAGFTPLQADVAGQTGGDAAFLSDVSPAASWTGNVALTYANGPFVTTLQERFVSGGKMDLQNPKTGPDDPAYSPNKSYSVSDNTNSAYYVLNLNASYDLKIERFDRMQVFGSISNLLDRDPPFSSGQVGGVNALNYDTLGRSYRLGVRIKL